MYGEGKGLAGSDRRFQDEEGKRSGTSLPTYSDPKVKDVGHGAPSVIKEIEERSLGGLAACIPQG